MIQAREKAAVINDRLRINASLARFETFPRFVRVLSSAVRPVDSDGRIIPRKRDVSSCLMNRRRFNCDNDEKKLVNSDADNCPTFAKSASPP
jgi:hypothetical protein